VLANMLQIVFRDTGTLIPIEKELQHCKDYLAIQQIRRPGQFDVVWNIPDAVQFRKTIPVVLQPIVENAVCHGLDQLSEDGCITITAVVEPDSTVFEIEDNGLGLDEAELTALRSNIRQAMIRESDHIGLSNVNQRLKLWFGEEYGVLVESRKYLGTKVTVRIPNIPMEATPSA